MKRALTLLFLLLWVMPGALAAELDFEEGRVTFFAEVQAPEGITQARELVCEGVMLEDNLLLESFGMETNLVPEINFDAIGTEIHQYTQEHAELTLRNPANYIYRCDRGSLLRGYTWRSTYEHPERTAPIEESETILCLQAHGLTLTGVFSGTQSGESVNRQLEEATEDLAWEEKKSGLVWHEGDFAEDSVVSLYRCAQVIEGIPVMTISRNLPGTDSFTYENETDIYTVDGEIVYFYGGVYSEAVECGEYAPILSAQEAARLFAEDYNQLLGVQERFCELVRLEYMPFQVEGELIYRRWKLAPVWVFYETEDFFEAQPCGAVHALTGEVVM